MLVTSSRILNQIALTVAGHNNTIVAYDVNPQDTIAPGADALRIGPSSFNRLPVIDTAANGRCNLHQWLVSFAPS